MSPMNNLSAISSTMPLNIIENAEIPATEAVEAPEIDFSAVMEQVMQESIANAAQNIFSESQPPIPGGFMPSADTTGFEQAMLTAASSGGMEDVQIALFMLMMMMQTGGDNDFSMQLQMMAALISQLSGGSDTVRANAMSSDFHPYILHTIDRDVFRMPTPEVTATGQAILPVDAWRPTTPAITSDIHNRSPQLYRQVVDQFNVETAERYRPFRNGNTFCNIFVWDVTRAMGAEIPHYTDPATGDPMFYPNIRGARSMGAIATCQWLRTHGERFGWREVDAETAQWHANQGRPAITSAGSLGHVQMVVPSTSGGFDPVRGVTIAQAGRINSNYMHISGIYSANTLANQVRYWIHD